MSRFSSGFVFGRKFVPPIGGNDAFTKVLLHMDGANGAQTFIDANAGGVSGRSWSAGSTTKNSSTQIQFGTASAGFSATGLNSTNWLQTANTTDLNPGVGAFSFDVWINRNGNTNVQDIAYYGDSNGGSSGFWFMFFDAGGHVILQMNRAGGFHDAVATAAVFPSTGFHHAYGAYDGGTGFYAAVDGAVTGAAGSGGAHTGTVGPLTLGAQWGSTSGFAALSSAPFYHDEARYSVGTVRWNASFTPPTGPYS